VPEDEGKTEGEDLFEDLDKFFAPIQDVDWPESSEPATPQAPPDQREEAQPEPEEPAEAGRDSTMAFETAPEEPVSEAAEAPGAASGDLFADSEPTPAGDEDADVEEVDAFLFEAEAEGDDGKAGGEPGADYVELPGDEDAGVAELEETAEERAREALLAHLDRAGITARDQLPPLLAGWLGDLERSFAPLDAATLDGLRRRIPLSG